MIRNTIKFFDKLEDITRQKLSKNPILYALVGGIGVVLFWRGVWHTTDLLTAYTLGEESITWGKLADGPLSFVLGTVILLLTGIYVSTLIGNKIIISDLKGEKTLTEKTEEEIKSEENQLKMMQKTLSKIENKISILEEEIEQHHPSK